jgi:hypothetical protein
MSTVAENGDEKKYRVQLDFSKEAFDELMALQRTVHASSRAEVIRNALGVLRWLTKHLKDKDKILVERRADSKRVEAEFPFLLL